MLKSFKEISGHLKNGLSINSQRADLLSLLMMAIIFCQTVNLSMLSKHLKTKTKQASCYKRLQRFIKEIALDQGQVAKMMLALAGVTVNQKLKLILDRTNWKFGKKHINILYLSAVTDKGNIPLFLELAGR
jgi:hypothetical protein